MCNTLKGMNTIWIMKYRFDIACACWGVLDDFGVLTTTTNSRNLVAPSLLIADDKTNDKFPYSPNRKYGNSQQYPYLLHTHTRDNNVNYAHDIT